MINRNPQLTALALLVKKFGDRIKGGYEVRISQLEMMDIQQGTLQEVPDVVTQTVRLQYYPNIIINAEGRVVPDEELKALPEPESDRPV